MGVEPQPILIVLRVSHWRTLHLSVVASGGLIHSGSLHSLPQATNFGQRIVWNCVRNNTVSGEHLEYLCPVSSGGFGGNDRWGTHRGPLE